MKFKALLITVLIAGTVQMAQAQTWVADSVEMGTGLSNDVYYSLANGTAKTQVANDWDLSFQMTDFFADADFTATVRANHLKRSISVFSLHKQASVNFTTLTAADTVGKTNLSQQLVNYETSWGLGAFTLNADPTNPFDFGWGQYAGPPSHFVYGDSIYLVKVGTAVYKLWIKEYISTGDTIGYKFRIASWDNSLDHDVYIKRKPNFENRIFAYYDIATNTQIDREPVRNTWDFMFTQYAAHDAQGNVIYGGPGGPQAFTGVFSATGLVVADVAGIDPNTANYQTYLGDTSDVLNEIGDDWKVFAGSSYEIDTNRSFFIRSLENNEYYQLRFTRFDLTGPRKIVFEKRKVSALKVEDVNSVVTAFAFAPNPAHNSTQIMLDAKEQAANTYIVVSDITGKTVQHMTVNLKKGMNAYSINTASLTAGMYIITINSGSFKAAEKLIVQH